MVVLNFISGICARFLGMRRRKDSSRSNGVLDRETRNDLLKKLKQAEKEGRDWIEF